MFFVISILRIILDLLALAIFIRAILAWFPIESRNPVVNFFFQITEPVLQPLRRMLPRVGVMDLSPLVAIVLILILRRLLASTI